VVAPPPGHSIGGREPRECLDLPVLQMGCKVCRCKKSQQKSNFNFSIFSPKDWSTKFLLLTAVDVKIAIGGNQMWRIPSTNIIWVNF